MRLPIHLRASFAASGASAGIISNGVAYFLLLYYSQVLGLDSALVGFAMMIALFVDAISDPWIGRWSDRMRSRWGRRHPFLFAAIIPIPLAYYLLWDAPDLSDTSLFVYLLVMTVVLRLSLTAHVVPFHALLPEVTSNYDARTRLSGDLVSSAWFFGTLMSVAMYGYWLADTPEYPDGAGIMRADGYVAAGGVGAIIVFACISYAAFATRRPIATPTEAPARERSLRAAIRQMSQTLADRSTLAIIASGLLSAMAGGTAAALWPYMQSYFWSFDTIQISLMLTAQLVSAVIAFLSIGYITRGRDKKRILITLSLTAIVVATGPVWLRVTGAFIGNDHELLFPVMLTIGMVEVALAAMTGTLTASMIADITEHRAIETARREEGRQACSIQHSPSSARWRAESGCGPAEPCWHSSVSRPKRARRTSARRSPSPSAGSMRRHSASSTWHRSPH